jgi:hypothetical protein
MAERVALNINVSSTADGTLQLVLLLANPRASLQVDATNITAMIWTESDDIVRIALQHPRSRVLAYLQGNRALRELCASLRLSLAEDYGGKAR